MHLSTIFALGAISIASALSGPRPPPRLTGRDQAFFGTPDQQTCRPGFHMIATMRNTQSSLDTPGDGPRRRKSSSWGGQGAEETTPYKCVRREVVDNSTTPLQPIGGAGGFHSNSSGWDPIVLTSNGSSTDLNTSTTSTQFAPTTSTLTSSSITTSSIITSSVAITPSLNGSSAAIQTPANSSALGSPPRIECFKDSEGRPAMEHKQCQPIMNSLVNTDGSNETHKHTNISPSTPLVFTLPGQKCQLRIKALSADQMDYFSNIEIVKVALGILQKCSPQKGFGFGGQMKMHGEGSADWPGFMVELKGLSKPASTTTNLGSTTWSATASPTTKPSSNPIVLPTATQTTNSQATASGKPLSCYRNDQHVPKLKIDDCHKLFDKYEDMSRSDRPIKYNATKSLDIKTFDSKNLNCKLRVKAASRKNKDKFSFDEIMGLGRVILKGCGKEKHPEGEWRLHPNEARGWPGFTVILEGKKKKPPTTGTADS